jgi:hypothetical protein
MSDLDPDRATEARTTSDERGRITEVTHTTERSSGAAWWAVALVGVALIAAVTYVITRPADNTNAAVAEATQQLQTQAASQQAQSAAAQAQAAADSAAQSNQRAASSTQPSPQQGAPQQSSQTTDQGDSSTPQ